MPSSKPLLSNPARGPKGPDGNRIAFSSPIQQRQHHQFTRPTLRKSALSGSANALGDPVLSIQGVSAPTTSSTSVVLTNNTVNSSGAAAATVPTTRHQRVSQSSLQGRASLCTPGKVLGGGSDDSGLQPQQLDQSSLSVTSIGAAAPLAGGNATRVSRLLRDARAAVQAPYRPDTPLDLLTPKGGKCKQQQLLSSGAQRVTGGGVRAPMKGTRLASLKAITSGGFGAEVISSSGVHKSGTHPEVNDLVSDSSSPLVSSTTQLEPCEFMVALHRAEGSPETQVRLLRTLMKWLANPSNQLWQDALAYLQGLLSRVSDGANAVASYPSAAVTTADSEISMPESFSIAEADTMVAAVAASVLLHNTTITDCPALPHIVHTLQLLATWGMVEILEQELMYEPLLHVLRTDSTLPLGHGVVSDQVLLDVLDILRRCTSRRQSGKTDSEEGEMAEAEKVCETTVVQLVTLGVIPVLNSFANRVLLSDTPTTNVSNNCQQECMIAVCLLYRNISTGFSYHLCRLGTLDILVRILEQYGGDPAVILAASRVIAKTVDDVECCTHYQQSERLTRAVAAALHTAQQRHQQQQQQQTADSNRRHQMLVSRLCAVLARVAEGCAVQQDFLALQYTATLIDLVETYVRPEALTAHAMQVSKGSEEDEGVSLLQGIVWLVGIVAISPHCDPVFVLHVLPRLVAFLKEATLSEHNRLTVIYTLMCISNLSYFFSAIESRYSSSASAGNAMDAASSSSPLEELFSVLGLTVAGFLFEGDVEATVEATRILGNMSYTNVGRDWMEANRCDEVVIIFLGHEDLRIAYNCFGVVLNLTAGTRSRITEDPELLNMLLQYTGRYTRRDDINAAAEEEKRLLMSIAQRAAADGRMLTEAEAAAATAKAIGELAAGYAEQIADLVEKVLSNVQGLVGM